MNNFQAKILEIMKEVHKLCVDNDIKYTMYAGTMIGAAREKGFIPWDDDMDICMTPEDYDKFLRVAETYTSDKYEILVPMKTPNYHYSFVKVVDKTTTLMEEIFGERYETCIGVYLDVFPLIEVDKDIDQVKIYKHRQFMTTLRNIKLRKHNDTWRRKLMKPVACMAPLKYFDKDFNKIYIKASKNTKGGDYYFDPDGYYKDGLIDKKWFDEYVLVPFEDTEFFAVKEYDKYLTQTIGDYMTRPPVEERVSHHHFYLDMDKPYKEFIEEKMCKKK